MTLRDIVLRVLGLEASPERIAQRIRRLEETATTGGTAEQVRSALSNTCPVGHSLSGHRYVVVSSVPLSADDEMTREVLSELECEDWPALTQRFGFDSGKSLDVVALRCPDDLVHVVALVSAHDPYARDVLLVRHRVKQPLELMKHVREWDSFDHPRRVEAPAAKDRPHS